MMKIFEGKTFLCVLESHKGMGPGFDFLRFALALLVLVFHVRWVVGSSLATPLGEAAGQVIYAAVAMPTWKSLIIDVAHDSILPAFFALSGFLVLGSAMRLRSTQIFLLYRSLRIFPALIVEVTLSALVLGPLLTTLPLAEYFSSPLFFHYFGNIVGDVHFYLPGVFESNAVKGIVNQNLWTLPSEFHCYLIAAFLLFTRIIYNRRMVAVAMAIATIVLVALPFVGEAVPSAVGLVYYFFAGALFFHFRAQLKINLLLFAGCCIAVAFFLSHKELALLACAPLTYCTLFIGMVQFGKIPVISTGDYSYGIYLYGFPITQTLIALAPQGTFNWITLSVAAGVCAFLFSIASWHGIEKHALALKGPLAAKWRKR